jgi:2-iminobutanoate/2-iminopropanoate deaminase
MPAKTAISSDAAPAAIGPYSQAVRAGKLVFTSGQVALDPATGALAPGGIQEQTERVFANLSAVLAAADLSFADVIKATVYLKNIGDFAAVNEIYAKYLASGGAVPPARTTIEVARLPKDALIEIDLIAVEP